MSLDAKETTLLIPLGNPEFRASAAGDKAASLHRLLAADFPVPPGFVVLSETTLDQIENELEAAVAALGGYPVVAHSSARLEDLGSANFTGQCAANPAATNVATLLESIAACRASACLREGTGYLGNNGFNHDCNQVSVLVQKTVDVSIAGVAFSIHPETGREEHGLIECGTDIGDRLVSGRTTPTRYVVNLEDGSVLERQDGTGKVQLSGELIHQLCRCALEVQAHFGTPQEIEWVVDRQGKFWILQCWPTTRINWRCDLDEFTNANFRDGGTAARVCTPLMYTMYRDAFQESMQKYFVSIKLLPKKAPQETWISMFYGRPYWSVSTVKKVLCKIPGYDEERFDRDLGIQKEYGNSGPVRTPPTLGTLLRVLPVAIALEQRYWQHLKMTESYGQCFLLKEANYLRLAESCRAMKDDKFFPLLIAILNFHQETESNYFTTVYNHANYQSDFNKLLTHITAATHERTSPLVLMSGLLSISHMRIQSGFARLVRTAREYGTESVHWQQAMSEFTGVNYFHGEAEVDISTPRWGECPERIRQMVEDVLQSGIEPKDPEATAQAQFELHAEEVRRIEAVLRRSTWHRLRFGRSFRKRLALARTYASRREEMREYSTRAGNVVRRYVLEAGRRLHQRGWLARPDDVFMLHTDELQAIAERRAETERILAATGFRRLIHQGYRSVEPPGELGRSVSKHVSSRQLLNMPADSLLKGTGCSAATVTACARVVTKISECNSLRPGEILVTRFIDPAWTPVMGLVSGVVTDVGGVLSHGAVISREYGLPAVLNVPGATQIIRTGQWLEVDGANGTVKILRDRAGRCDA